MVQRIISLNSVSHFINGKAGDLYFENFTLDNETNDFLQYAITKCISPTDTILDIGANIGITALLLSSAVPEGSVLAIEPDLQTYEYLKQTLADNNIHNCIPYQFALGSKNEYLPFMSVEGNSSGSRLAPEEQALGGHNSHVPVKKLDDFVASLNLKSVDFIKIDTEGFEMDVLHGGIGVLQQFMPKLFIEFNSFTLIAFGNRNPRELLSFLRGTFPYVYQFKNGQVSEIQNEEAAFSFIHDNLVRHGCVDDLMCSFQPLFV